MEPGVDPSAVADGIGSGPPLPPGRVASLRAEFREEGALGALIAFISTIVVFGLIVWLVLRSEAWPQVRDQFLNRDDFIGLVPRRPVGLLARPAALRRRPDPDPGLRPAGGGDPQPAGPGLLPPPVPVRPLHRPLPRDPAPPGDPAPGLRRARPPARRRAHRSPLLGGDRPRPLLLGLHRRGVPARASSRSTRASARRPAPSASPSGRPCATPCSPRPCATSSPPCSTAWSPSRRTSPWSACSASGRPSGRREIYTSRTFNYTSYVAATVLFLLASVPIARFADWYTARDRRRRSQTVT